MNVVTFLDCEVNEHCFHANFLFKGEKLTVFSNVRNGSSRRKIVSKIHAFAGFHFLIRGGVGS